MGVDTDTSSGRRCLCVCGTASVEEFSQVHDADGFALAAQATGNVHQAASIARHQGVSPSALEAGDLFLQHGIGDFRVFHGKGTAKATALFCQIHGDQLSALDLADQAAWLLCYTEFAEEMT